MNRGKKDRRESPLCARGERKTAAIDNRVPLTTSGAEQPPTSSDSPLRYHSREVGRPILNAMRAAAEEEFARLPVRLSEIQEEIQRLKSEGKLTVEHQELCGKELVASFEEWVEITGWIHPQDALLSDARKLEIATLMRESGFAAEDALAVVRKAGYFSRGRPATHRSMTIQATEMKMLNPELTWKEITKRLCTCRKGAHDSDCERTLCRDVTRLRTVLRKHGITFSKHTLD